MLPRLNNGFLALGNVSVPFELRRSRRRRTLGLTVTTQQVRIHAPSWTPRAEIEHFVQQQDAWLQRTWARVQAQMPDTAQAKPSELLYLGHKLALKFHESLFTEVRRTGEVLHVFSPGSGQMDALRNWLRAQASKILAWRMARLARKQGLVPKQFALSNAQTQWGSCTRNGHVRLNWRLIQAPLTLIDYVVAHELAHLVHLDHSPKFWALVAHWCPDSLARRAALQKMSIRLFQI